MDQIPNEQKEQLRKAKIDIDNNIKTLGAARLQLKKQGKINTPFLIVSIVTAFLYPIVAGKFDWILYSVLWFFGFMFFIYRIEIFLKIIKNELDFAGLTIIQTAIENDLEIIRKREYDELTRKIYPVADSQKAQGSPESAQ